MELTDTLFSKITDQSIGQVIEFKVEHCPLSHIALFIEKWHYSKNVNGLAYDYCFKLLDSENNLIGGMIYGDIAMADVWKKYASNKKDLIELKRLCCIDKTPKNTESYFIGKTLKWLKKNTNIKKVISYADKTFGHEGIIYKASNFKFMGETKPGKVIWYHGKRYHDKTIRTKYNGELKPFAKKISEALKNGEAYYAESKPKNVYLYELK